MEVFDKLKELFGLSLIKTEEINLTFGAIIALVVALILTTWVLKIFRKVVTRNIPAEDKNKFISIFQFAQYLIYVFVVMFTLRASGIDISVLLTASAAIFIGLGFALQQLFQDIISGILIILDQSLHVGDIIEVEGKVCRVEKISLRYTKAITRNERVMIIPNHKFLNNVLFNWTQNNNDVRESVEVGVAYGSDLELVRKILSDCAEIHPEVLKKPKPIVFFENFGDSSLDFSVFFFVDNAFVAPKIKSYIRFAIDQAFRQNKVAIPFPQRDVHLFSQNP
jgi:small-conductance mechanosensitive channel